MAPKYGRLESTDPARPFCRRYILPKFDRLRAALPHLVDPAP